MADHRRRVGAATRAPTLGLMFDVLVLRPGGGFHTDTTGSLQRCRQRVRDLAGSNRRPKAVTRIQDRRTGRMVEKGL